MTLDERVKAKQEERCVLLLQRDQVTRQLDSLTATKAQLTEAVFACDGAVRVLVELQAESTPPTISKD